MDGSRSLRKGRQCSFDWSSLELPSDRDDRTPIRESHLHLTAEYTVADLLLQRNRDLRPDVGRAR